MPIMVKNKIKTSNNIIEKIKEKYWDGEYFLLEKIAPIPINTQLLGTKVTREALEYVIYLKDDSELEKIEEILKCNIKFLMEYLDKPYKSLLEIKSNITTQELENINNTNNNYESWYFEEKYGIKSLKEYGELCLNSIIEHGCFLNLNWFKNNWGTYGIAWLEKANTDKLILYTESTPPFPIFKKLSLEFPDDYFFIEYEDDAPCMSGIVVFKNGEFLEHEPLDNDEIRKKYNIEEEIMEYEEEFDI